VAAVAAAPVAPAGPVSPAATGSAGKAAKAAAAAGLASLLCGNGTALGNASAAAAIAAVVPAAVSDLGYGVLPAVSEAELVQFWVVAGALVTLARLMGSSMGWTIVRRWAFCFGTLTMLHGLARLATVRSKPASEMPCRFSDAADLSAPWLAALAVVGQAPACADAAFSSHAISVLLCAFVWLRYTKQQSTLPGVFARPVRAAVVLYVAVGFALLLATRMVSSQDLVVWFALTWLIWNWYHLVAVLLFLRELQVRSGLAPASYSPDHKLRSSQSEPGGASPLPREEQLQQRQQHLQQHPQRVPEQEEEFGPSLVGVTPGGPIAAIVLWLEAGAEDLEELAEGPSFGKHHSGEQRWPLAGDAVWAGHRSRSGSFEDDPEYEAAFSQHGKKRAVLAAPHIVFDAASPSYAHATAQPAARTASPLSLANAQARASLSSTGGYQSFGAAYHD
jgi:hypothetical protein